MCRVGCGCILKNAFYVIICVYIYICNMCLYYINIEREKMQNNRGCDMDFVETTFLLNKVAKGPRVLIL